MKIRFTWKVENPFTATKTDIFPLVGLKFRFYHPIIGNHNKEKKTTTNGLISIKLQLSSFQVILRTRNVTDVWTTREGRATQSNDTGYLIWLNSNMNI